MTKFPEPEEPCECGGDRWVWDHTDDIENPVRVPCPACRPEGEEDRA